MRVAKIKFSEAQVRMIITGKTVVVNLPDAQLHLTMDTTRIETRRAAEGFADVGKKSRFDDFDSRFHGRIERQFVQGHLQRSLQGQGMNFAIPL